MLKLFGWEIVRGHIRKGGIGPVDDIVRDPDPLALALGTTLVAMTTLDASATPCSLGARLWLCTLSILEIKSNSGRHFESNSVMELLSLLILSYTCSSFLRSLKPEGVKTPCIHAACLLGLGRDAGHAYERHACWVCGGMGDMCGMPVGSGEGWGALGPNQSIFSFETFYHFLLNNLSDRALSRDTLED